MSTLIEILLALLPYAVKWLKEIFNKAAKEVQPTGNQEQDAKALLEKSLELTPRTRPIRRGILRHLIHVAPKAVAEGGKLPKDDMRELKQALAQAE